jgi:hypothetical protein
VASAARGLAAAADHSATSRALPPDRAVAVIVASLQTRPRTSGSVAGRPVGSRAWSKEIAPWVSVPVLSVNNTSMLPRSSMVTSRFTSTRRRASSLDPLLGEWYVHS